MELRQKWVHGSRLVSVDKMVFMARVATTPGKKGAELVVYGNAEVTVLFFAKAKATLLVTPALFELKAEAKVGASSDGSSLLKWALLLRASSGSPKKALALSNACFTAKTSLSVDLGALVSVLRDALKPLAKKFKGLSEIMKLLAPKWKLTGWVKSISDALNGAASSSILTKLQTVLRKLFTLHELSFQVQIGACKGGKGENKVTKSISTKFVLDFTLLGYRIGPLKMGLTIYPTDIPRTIKEMFSGVAAKLVSSLVGKAYRTALEWARQALLPPPTLPKSPSTYSRPPPLVFGRSSVGVNLPSCVKSIANSSLTPRILPPPCRRPPAASARRSSTAA